MFRAARTTYGMGRGAANEGAPVHVKVIGDNLRSRIPDRDVLLGCPSVKGALNVILGEDWQIYPHDFVHASLPNDQGFHQDRNLPWNDRGHDRTHRPDWAMVFYYPQETDHAAGPTEVLPGTQYWTIDHKRPDRSWHRGDVLGPGLPPYDHQAATLEERDARIPAVADSWGIANVKR